MSQNDSRHTNASLEADRVLERLLRDALPRERPPESVEREVKAALLEEWDAIAGRRVAWRRAGIAAAAIAAIAVLVSVALRIDDGPVVPVVARVERLAGTVRAGEGERTDARLTLGAEIVAGSTLSTGQGLVALRLSDGGSLRLARGTELRMSSPLEAELVSGALYFDSENGTGAVSDAQFVVHTSAGTVRDVGTQFLARIDERGLDVGVRDGRVSVTRGDSSATAGAGERLTVGTDGIGRGSIDPVGAEWEWAHEVAPPFDIDGRRLVELLEWVAAQTGRSVVYADADAERIARDTVLRGSIDLEPLSKLGAALATTDLTYRLEGGTIVVSVK